VARVFRGLVRSSNIVVVLAEKDGNLMRATSADAG
jgi:hypothetical protein